jgi:excisionase family DNA binding protein
MSDRVDVAAPVTMTLEEAGQKLRISRNTAYRAARDGEIPTIRIGRSIRVPTAAFQKMLEGVTDGRE